MVLVGTTAVLAGRDDARPGAVPADATTRPGVHLRQALERVSTESLADWASVADHVVSGTVVAEERDVAPEGAGLVRRKVTVEVVDVLWSRDGAHRSAPGTFTVSSDAGWIRYDDGSEQETSREGSSRLEVGHEYVVGLVWKPAQCAGDLRVPARWAIIGSGAIVPADGGVIGVGEFEGATIGDPDDVGPGVAVQFEGDDVAALGEALRQVRSADRVAFVGPAELCDPVSR